MLEIKVVQGYYLAEFCQLIEPLLKDGWRFDYETNERFPTAFGSFYSATLVREEAEVKTEEVVKADTEVTTDTNIEEVQTTKEEVKAKPGRKPKAE